MAQRFRSEIKLARKVSHPNVCRIHEYGEDGAISYISMELIEGDGPPKRLLRRPEGPARRGGLRIALQVAEGLQAIHDVGIIHRDLKSPNIMLRRGTGVVRLMDFGIAKESRTQRRAHGRRRGHGDAGVHEPGAVPRGAPSTSGATSTPSAS